MRHHQYANTTAQQQPQRLVDRQQQQSSGSGDHQPPRPAPLRLVHSQLGGTQTADVGSCNNRRQIQSS